MKDWLSFATEFEQLSNQPTILNNNNFEFNANWRFYLLNLGMGSVAVMSISDILFTELMCVYQLVDKESPFRFYVIILWDHLIRSLSNELNVFIGI